MSRRRFPDRRRHALVSLAFALACGGASTAPSPVLVDPPAPKWTLSWHDEFEGAAGAAPDGARWVHDVGGSGWGNQEREYYTASTANAALDGAGNLAITAVAEPATTSLSCWYGPCRYTSARLLTQGRFSQAYGRFEARIRIPRGQGIWPAFWMLGDDIATAGWPASGEIDVMEAIGRDPNTAYGTIHGPNLSIGGSYAAPAALADSFHVYAAEWEPGVVRFYVDSVQYKSITSADVTGGGKWVFDHPYFLLLNVAVGGSWPGDPDGTSTFPQRMLVDYVRVYRR